MAVRPLCVFSLLFNLALLALAQDCTLVTDLVKQQFERYYMLQRRGCPQHFTLTFFSHYIHEFVNFSVFAFPDGGSLGSTCVSPAQLNEFYLIYHMGAVDHTLDVMYLLDENLFFLPTENYPDSALLPLDDDSQREVDGLWRDIADELKKPPSVVNTDKLTVLPVTLDILFDPNYIENKHSIANLATLGHDSMWPATTMIAKVLGIVVRLELLHVPRADSLQILAHCVAVVFKYVRAGREEGNRAVVSAAYMPWYEEAFRNLTASLDVSTVPEISSWSIEGFYRDEVSFLTSFETWGKITHYNYDRSGVKLVSIEDQIFDPEVLEDIRRDLRIGEYGYNHGSRDDRNSLYGSSSGYGPGSWRTEVQLGNETKWARLDGEPQCNERSYFFHSYEGQEVREEECCAAICKNLMMLATVGVSSTDGCCRLCNQKSCPFQSGNPLVELSTISVIPYGYDEGTSIPVMI